MAEETGWGSDFDEDGNVIGEVPDDSQESFAFQHKVKIGLVWAAVFAIQLPNLVATVPSVGGLIGSVIMSFVVAFAIVYAYVWIKS